MRAVIVGEGGLRENLEFLSRELGIETIVKFLGFREDSLRLLSAFHIFCLSSREEGLGTSVLDAMALRIPVVATNAGGIPEMVQDGVTGYLAPVQDPAQLAKALERAILDLGKNQNILDRAFKRAHDFDIANTVLRTEAAYLSTKLST